MRTSGKVAYRKAQCLETLYLYRHLQSFYFSTLDRVEQWGCHRPLIKPYVRFSRIRLSDILLPSAFSRKY